MGYTIDEFQRTRIRFPVGTPVVSPGNPTRRGVVRGYTLHPRGLVVGVKDDTAKSGERETITHAGLWHPATNWPDSPLPLEEGPA